MQFHIIKMNFILDDNIFAFKWLHLTNWHAQEIFSGVQCRSKKPVTPGISLSNQLQSASIFEVFISIHEYANEIIFI